MWKERVRIYYTPGVSNNFPVTSYDNDINMVR